MLIRCVKAQIDTPERHQQRIKTGAEVE
jgi:hypothetical protein